MRRKCIAKGVDINPYLLKFATDVKSFYGHQAALSWMSHLISHTLHSPGKWLRLVQDNNMKSKKKCTLNRWVCLTGCDCSTRLTFVSVTALPHAVLSITALAGIARPHTKKSNNLFGCQAFQIHHNYRHGYQSHYDRSLKLVQSSS